MRRKTRRMEERRRLARGTRGMGFDKTNVQLCCVVFFLGLVYHAFPLLLLYFLSFRSR